jgi:hypothetical protein
VERCGPAPGAPFELDDLLGEQRPVVQLPEQPVDLPRPEPEVVGTHLADRVRQPQPGEVQGRAVARQRQQVHRRRQVRHRGGDRGLARRPDDRVELVDDEQQALGAIGMPGADGRTGLLHADEDVGDSVPAAPRPRRVRPRLGEVLAQRRLVAVDRVGAVPQRRCRAAMGEVARGRGLASAGRADDHGQGHVPGAIEQAVHPFSSDRPHCRRLEPGHGKA